MVLRLSPPVHRTLALAAGARGAGAAAFGALPAGNPQPRGQGCQEPCRRSVRLGLRGCTPDGCFGGCGGEGELKVKPWVLAFLTKSPFLRFYGRWDPFVGQEFGVQCQICRCFRNPNLGLLCTHSAPQWHPGLLLKKITALWGGAFSGHGKVGFLMGTVIFVNWGRPGVAISIKGDHQKFGLWKHFQLGWKFPNCGPEWFA